MLWKTMLISRVEVQGDFNNGFIRSPIGKAICKPFNSRHGSIQKKIDV
jgi:hypothetical protein